jgi:hypothetical protein
MNKRYLSLASMMTLCFLLLLVSGCGSSSNKESGSTGVSRVGETSCITCHSTSVEKLTGAPIVANYTASAHNLHFIGCQDCHGGGASHEGKGPIPYASPGPDQCANCHSGTGLANFKDSRHFAGADEEAQKCNRCHTHQGAVLANISGFTGDKNVMDALVGAPGNLTADEMKHITCNTCHESHKTDSLRTVAGTGGVGIWDPNSNGVSDQFDLCTSCHVYKNAAGTLVGSGSTASKTAPFYHNTAWYRIIATTHYDNPATPAIEGYVIREKGANPCFDCHGHEFKTNTRQNQTPPKPNTIWTDWGKSGHAGGILTAKYAAAKNPNGTWKSTSPTATGQAVVDAVMAAGADSSWNADPWNSSAEANCQRCHTSTGAMNYFNSPSTYTPANNDFSHLSGWTAAGGSPQSEVLYCWACHSNAGNGTLRAPGAITSKSTMAGYTYFGADNKFPNVGASNLCVACHAGRGGNDNVLASTSLNNVSRAASAHYLPAAGVMYMKTGFISFVDDLKTPVPTISSAGVINPTGTTYEKTLKPNSDGVAPVDGGVAGGTTSRHRRLGTADIFGAETWIPKSGVFDTGGPCVTCHVNANVSGMPAASLGTNVGGTYNGSGPFYIGAMIAKRSGSHTFSARSAEAAQQVCNPCHGDEAELLAPGVNGAEAKLEEAQPAYLAGLEVAKRLMETKYNLRVVSDGISVSIYDLTLDASGRTAVRDWTRGGTLSTANAKKLIGAAFNIKLLYADPGAYVHGRTYTQRLLFDTVDWLDDGIMNQSSAATYVANAAAANAVAATKNYLRNNANPQVASWLWKNKAIRP